MGNQEVRPQPGHRERHGKAEKVSMVTAPSNHALGCAVLGSASGWRQDFAPSFFVGFFSPRLRHLGQTVMLDWSNILLLSNTKAGGLVLRRRPRQDTCVRILR